MGLTVTAKGLTEETGLDCGYITFEIYRIQVAKAHNKRFRELFEKWAKGIASSNEKT